MHMLYIGSQLCPRVFYTCAPWVVYIPGSLAQEYYNGDMRRQRLARNQELRCHFLEITEKILLITCIITSIITSQNRMGHIPAMAIRLDSADNQYPIFSQSQYPITDILLVTTLTDTNYRYLLIPIF